MTLGDAQVPPGTVHTTGANRGITPGSPRPARVTTTHPVEARSVEYGHEPCPHCPGRTTVVYVHGWRTDDGVVDQLRAVVGETHSGRCPFRPDAPQPATTDDAVERAARAVREYVETGGQDHGVIVADRLLRRHLAAAGAGAEVDREALVAAVRPAIYDARWNRAFGRSPMLPTDQVLSEVAVDAVLAARGDAATPTEVEWAIRFGPGSQPMSFDEDGSALTEEGARQEVRENPGSVLMQRDVHRSAWREVEGSEHRA